MDDIQHLDDIHLTPDSERKSPDSDHGFIPLDVKSCDPSIDSGKIGSFKYTTTGVNRLVIPSSVELEDRERQLAVKEREIAEKARELEQRFGYTVTDGDGFDHGRSGRATTRTPKSANWPHPTWCPWVRHHIEEDIELHHQPLLRIAYLLWRLVAIGFLCNITTVITAAFHANYYGSPAAASNAVFTAVLFGGAAIPLSFAFWYLNLYKLCVHYTSTRHMVLVMALAVHGIVSVVMVLGMPWYPCAGVFFAIINFGTGHLVVAAMAVLNTAIWTLVVALSTLTFRGVRVQFTANGQSVMTLEEVQDGVRRSARREIGNVLHEVVWGADL